MSIQMIVDVCHVYPDDWGCLSCLSRWLGMFVVSIQMISHSCSFCLACKTTWPLNEVCFSPQSVRATHAGQPWAPEEEQRQIQENQPQAAGRQEQVRGREEKKKNEKNAGACPSWTSLHVPFYLFILSSQRKIHFILLVCAVLIMLHFVFFLLLPTVSLKALSSPLFFKCLYISKWTYLTNPYCNKWPSPKYNAIACEFSFCCLPQTVSVSVNDCRLIQSNLSWD